MLKLKDMTCLLSRWACLLGLLVAPTVGCSDLSGEGGAGGSGGTAGTGGSGGSGGAGGAGGAVGPELAQVYWSLFENNPDGEDPPIEDVKICIEDSLGINCAMTNVQGKAVLDFATNEEVIVTIEKDNYNSYIMGFVEDTDQGPFDSLMFSDDQLEALAAQLGTTYPWQGGIVGLWLGNRVGATFAPVGPSIDAVGEAFYFDATTEQYRLDLEAIPDPAYNGEWFAVPVGEGGFTEVTPGVQQFEVGGAVGECHGPVFGWPGDAPNRVRVPVREGFISRSFMSDSCDAP